MIVLFGYVIISGITKNAILLDLSYDVSVLCCHVTDDDTVKRVIFKNKVYDIGVLVIKIS